MILVPRALAHGGSAGAVPAVALSSSGSVRWWVGGAMVAMVVVV